jgi:hypothetical protein
LFVCLLLSTELGGAVGLEPTGRLVDRSSTSLYTTVKARPARSSGTATGARALDATQNVPSLSRVVQVVKCLPRWPVRVG